MCSCATCIYNGWYNPLYWTPRLEYGVYLFHQPPFFGWSFCASLSVCASTFTTVQAQSPLNVLPISTVIAWPSFHEHLCSHTNIKTLNVLKIDSEQTQKYAPPPFFPRFHWMTHGTTFSFKLRFLSFLYLFIKVLAECTYKPMSTYDLFPFTRQSYKIHCTSMPDFPSQSPQISIKHKQFNMN